VLDPRGAGYCRDVHLTLFVRAQPIAKGNSRGRFMVFGFNTARDLEAIERSKIGRCKFVWKLRLGNPLSRISFKTWDYC